MNDVNPTIPPEGVLLLKEIHYLLNFDKFVVYGGCALDMLLGDKSPIHDIDIAIKGFTEDKINECNIRLRNAGYQILCSRREYYININQLVVMTYAKGKWLLDIAFMEDVNKIGQFDIGSLFWRYPEMDYVDHHGAIKAYNNKTIKPIHGLDKENPIMLTSIFIKLCAKYNLNITDNPIHSKIAKELVMRTEKWRHPGQFHGPIARASATSSFLSSILRSNCRDKYIIDLYRSGIIKLLSPQLSHGIDSNPNRIKYIHERLFSANSKESVFAALLDVVNKDQREMFSKSFNILTLRSWDIQDKKFLNSNNRN